MIVFYEKINTREEKKPMKVKRKPIKPNLPSMDEIGKIFRNRDGRSKKTKNVQPEPELVKCSERSPGRPQKWQAGDQMRLSTRVRPETHKALHKEAKRRKLSVGELIDEWRLNVSLWEAGALK